MRHPRLPRPVLFALLALSILSAAAVLRAAAGYTIVLKDGATIVAKEKYRIEGTRAIITQLNGTQTFVRADQIDVPRTEAANRNGYGSAVIIPGSPQDIGTPPVQTEKDRTIADLARGGTSAREIPTVRRDKGEPVPGRLIKTKAGFLDLSTLPRKPYTYADLTAEMQQFFRSQGVEEVEIYQGTQTDRPLLEITTNSEGSVFKALSTTANALLHMRESFPGKIAAFEVLLTTPSRERAGQFVLTPDMATDLVSKKVDVTSFFVKNVQF
jgi:hypothetical protein